jgi:ribonuclease VapC
VSWEIEYTNEFELGWQTPFLAYLRDEAGAEIVENALIDGCYISIINWVEVLSKVVDLGESPNEIILR